LSTYVTKNSVSAALIGNIVVIRKIPEQSKFFARRKVNARYSFHSEHPNPQTVLDNYNRAKQPTNYKPEYHRNKLKSNQDKNTRENIVSVLCSMMQKSMPTFSSLTKNTNAMISRSGNRKPNRLNDRHALRI
jgi:hypothetical protein